MKTEKDENLIICPLCKKEFPNDDEFEKIPPDDEKICRECFDDNYFVCEDCEEAYHQNAGYYSNDSDYRICEHCADNYCSCHSCGNIIHKDNSYRCSECENNYCEDCYNSNDHQNQCHPESEENNFNDRQVKQNNKYIHRARRGKIIKNTRGFGLEIETISPDYTAIDMLFDKLPKEYGIVKDGSLSDGGLEVQTPIIAGNIAEKEIKGTAKILNENNFLTDKTCGLHIHINTPELANNEFTLTKNLMLFYYLFEPAIMSILPKSRQRNDFCRQLKNIYSLQKIKKARNRNSLEILFYKPVKKSRKSEINEVKKRKSSKHDTSRYAGFNFHSLFFANNLEIRYHSGTVNEVKLIFWSALHTLIVDKIIKGKITLKLILSAEPISDTRKLAQKMLTLIKAPKNLRNYYWERYKIFSQNYTPAIINNPLNSTN